MRIDPGNFLAALQEAEETHRFSVSAFSTAMAYFSSIGHKPEPLEVSLENSPLFGGRDEKSGLGSSAASTVALIAAIMDGNGFEVGKKREVIHKLGQISHALAAGSSGSGFDIATSAFGTIEYVRFDKNLIKVNEGMAPEAFSEAVGRLVKMDWPRMSIKKTAIEPYGLLAFNIKGGKTSTISSVRAVRKLIEHAPELYENLIRDQALGEKEALEGLHRKDDQRIRDGMHSAREHQRLLSGWVGRIGMLNFDPIEPPALTELIARAEELPGIIAGRCPGSGGFDSVAFLTEGAPDAAKIREIGKELGLSLEQLKITVSAEGVKKV
jgi:phosphomevalonate kinase